MKTNKLHVMRYLSVASVLLLLVMLIPISLLTSCFGNPVGSDPKGACVTGGMFPYCIDGTRQTCVICPSCRYGDDRDRFVEGKTCAELGFGSELGSPLH